MLRRVGRVGRSVALCAVMSLGGVLRASPVSAQPAPTPAHVGEAVRVSGAVSVSFPERDLIVRTRPPRDDRCAVGVPCDNPGVAAVHVEVTVASERVAVSDVLLSGLALQSSADQTLTVGDLSIGLRALNQGNNGEPLFLVVQAEPFADPKGKAPIRQLRNARVVQLDAEASLLDQQRANVVSRSGELLTVLRLEDGGSTLTVAEPGTLRVIAQLLVPDRIVAGMRMTTPSGLVIEFRRRTMVVEDRRPDRSPPSPMAVRVTFRVTRDQVKDSVAGP